ncbi:MAG: hypothetical protein WBM17_17445, partial [Anaerolineales bacterium]
MKKRKFSWVTSVLIILLAGCSQASMTAIGMDTNYIIPSKTPAITLTMSSTPTNTTTHTATITPTMGPPPDLELQNVSIYPDHENIVGDFYFIMGRIRNNTDNTMIFFGKDVVINFKLETWQGDKNQAGELIGIIKHSIYTDRAIRGTENTRSMNCILYP